MKNAVTVWRETDGHFYLFPSIGLNFERLQDFSRDYELEVKGRVVTHRIWLRVLAGRYQRTICYSLNLNREPRKPIRKTKVEEIVVEVVK